MAKTKPWEILNLSCKQDLSSSARIILSQRLESLLSSINSYFTEVSIENSLSVLIEKNIWAFVKLFHHFKN